jgi:homogentisate 1,2-dioxygenase
MQRTKNQFSWLYKIWPSSCHHPWEKTAECKKEDEEGCFISNFTEKDKRLEEDPR